jgi:periplasmic protein TonB
VTVSQFPQPGDVVAKRVQDQGGAELHGAVLVARRDEPLQSEATDLSNVVPFARPRRHGAAAPFPLPSVAASERPAPHVVKTWIGTSIALFAASLALHSVLLAMFWHEPRPMASIGIEAMTVEIVLGATTPAGLAPTPREQESAPASPSGENVEHEPVTEQSRATTVMPQEVPVAAQETAPEVKPEEMPAEAQTVDPRPQEQQPETAVAETLATAQPTEKAEPPRPRVQAVQKAPERKRVEAPTDKKAAQKKERAVTQQSNSASGVGIGRSDKSANYPGIVRAHLVRYKQSPSGTPGSKGVATVQFLVDGSGRVTSARLVKSSGVAAFDQEIVAMARRASPFPRPHDGKGGDFTVSVMFEVR